MRNAQSEPSEEGSEVDRVDVFLDDGDEPIATYRPPARIQFDSNRLEDGRHEMQIEATGPEGSVGRRSIDFEVRNGPAIDVEGLNAGDTVSDDVTLMVHAWGGAGQEDWEASRAESPAPAPTWAWVMLIIVFAWALFYGVSYWRPTGEAADSPTYPAVQTEQSDQ